MLAFALLAAGAGWWQVVDRSACPRRPTTRPCIAAARRTVRGPIVDRDGRWLARSSRDVNGEAQRTYRDDTMSQVIGYASRQFGTTGLERTYNAELLGLIGWTRWRPARQVRRDPHDAAGPRAVARLRLQRAAVKALGCDHGAVVMLDPTTGEVLALASTPTYDASAIANPATAAATFAGSAPTRTTRSSRGRRWAVTCPGPCSRS